MHFQDDLFDSGPEISQLSGGNLTLTRNFLEPDSRLRLFNGIMKKTRWEGGTIFIGGKDVPIPRLNAWYASENKTFTYSGLRLSANSWFSELEEIKTKVEEATDRTFNSCLLNLYRDGYDSVAWHCDDEPELGRNPVIASVSLGSERKFIIRSLHDHSEKYTFVLPSGSLLLMDGELQHRYEHQVPKEKNITTPRINLTFRKLVN